MLPHQCHQRSQISAISQRCCRTAVSTAVLLPSSPISCHCNRKIAISQCRCTDAINIITPGCCHLLTSSRHHLPLSTPLPHCFFPPSLLPYSCHLPMPLPCCHQPSRTTTISQRCHHAAVNVAALPPSSAISHHCRCAIAISQRCRAAAMM